MRQNAILSVLIDYRWNRAATDTHKTICCFGCLFRSTAITFVFPGCLHLLDRMNKQVAGNVAVSRILK